MLNQHSDMQCRHSKWVFNSLCHNIHPSNLFLRTCTLFKNAESQNYYLPSESKHMLMTYLRSNLKEQNYYSNYKNSAIYLIIFIFISHKLTFSFRTHKKMKCLWMNFHRSLVEREKTSNQAGCWSVQLAQFWH